VFPFAGQQAKKAMFLAFAGGKLEKQRSFSL
jgi:hypothetical protein